jgi:hypothetical protein
MAKRHIRRLLTAAVAASVLLFGWAVPAQADSTSTWCQTNDILGNPLYMDGVAYYYTSGSYHVWNEFDFLLSGAGTGGKSNELIRFYDNGPQVWSWTSGDNLQSYIWYGVGANIWVLASHTERAWFKAIFDNFGPDPRCDNSTPTI